MFGKMKKQKEETYDEKVKRIVEVIGNNFRTFGEGKDNDLNPISAALKNHPLTFAGDVNVEEVVHFVLEEEQKCRVKKVNSRDIPVTVPGVDYH